MLLKSTFFKGQIHLLCKLSPNGVQLITAFYWYIYPFALLSLSSVSCLSSPSVYYLFLCSGMKTAPHSPGPLAFHAVIRLHDVPYEKHPYERANVTSSALLLPTIHSSWPLLVLEEVILACQQPCRMTSIKQDDWLQHSTYQTSLQQRTVQHHALVLYCMDFIL